MTSRSAGARVTALAVAWVLAAAMAAAQSETWSPPRTSDGQPDIQGFWTQRGLTIPTYSLEDGPPLDHATIIGQALQVNRPSAVVDPPDGRAPYQPWAAAQRKAVFDNHNDLKLRNQMDPQDRCFLGGPTRFFSLGNIQILQSPGYVVLLNEFAHAFRTVPLDARPRLGETVKLWQGDSRGRWEGNTLVIETTNSNDKTWFDKIGSFHSDSMRLTERLTLVNATTLSYRATVDDPLVFTRPWTIGLTLGPVDGSSQGFELIEQACYEGDAFGREVFATLKGQVAR
ncbi:MAG TPA: hypothetical protein VIX63_10525 [Vicinamibacterales bacterium]